MNTNGNGQDDQKGRPSLILIIEGKMQKGVNIEDADAAVECEVADLILNGVSETELEKAKNKTESMVVFEDMNLLARANNLAFYELLGDANLMNTELEKYQTVSTDELKAAAMAIFDKNNSNTLYYIAKQ